MQSFKSDFKTIQIAAVIPDAPVTCTYFENQRFEN